MFFMISNDSWFFGDNYKNLAEEITHIIILILIS